MRKNRDLKDNHRLALIEVYLSGSLSRHAFEKKNGLSHNAIKNWLTIFDIEDKPNAYEMKYGKELKSKDPETEELKKSILDLKLKVKKLEHDLKESNMARDAYDYMIQLAEETYAIPVRKNSDAK